MTIQDIVVKWNSTWRFDYWWRRKYNASFNSDAHREMSQIDIKFEYVENYLADQEYEKYKSEQKSKKKKKKQVEEELFNKLKI